MHVFKVLIQCMFIFTGGDLSWVFLCLIDICKPEPYSHLDIYCNLDQTDIVPNHMCCLFWKVIWTKVIWTNIKWWSSWRLEWLCSKSLSWSRFAGILLKLMRTFLIINFTLWNKAALCIIECYVINFHLNVFVIICSINRLVCVRKWWKLMLRYHNVIVTVLCKLESKMFMKQIVSMYYRHVEVVLETLGLVLILHFIKGSFSNTTLNMFLNMFHM